jgi:hypothetical protein
MPDVNAPKQDRIGNDYREGPNPNPGGEIDTGDSLIPPYDGRTTSETANDAGRESVERMLQHRDAGRPGAIASPSVESPAREDKRTDDAPESPLGAGANTNTAGEGQVEPESEEAGHHDLGHDGADGPTGMSDERDRTGV